MNITPGPWRSTRHSCKMVKVENKDRVIFDGFHGEEGNALLAAAAPELLEALRDLHEYTKAVSSEYRNALSPQIDGLYVKVHAALHKATQPTP